MITLTTLQMFALFSLVGLVAGFGYLFGLFSKFVFRAGVKEFVREEVVYLGKELEAAKAQVQAQCTELIVSAQREALNIYSNAEQAQNTDKTTRLN